MYNWDLLILFSRGVSVLVGDIGASFPGGVQQHCEKYMYLLRRISFCALKAGLVTKIQ